MPIGLTILIATEAACWTLACVLIGISIGWRVRGGQQPVPPLPNLLAAKPKPPKPPEPPIQEKV